MSAARERLVVSFGLRLRAYGLAVLLVLLSVPFLHLYLHVDLSIGELAVHTLDIGLGSVVGLLAVEIALSAWQRRLDWRFPGRARAVAAVGLAAALGLSTLLWAPRDWLPGTADIRQKHVASGYGDMSIRILPLVGLIGYFAWAASRRALLREELAQLRRLNAQWAARAANSPPAGRFGREVRPLVYPQEGGALRVDPRQLVRAQARENYCELVLADRPTSRNAPLVRTTLSELADRLPSDAFVRTHRSHLVNLERVVEMARSGRGAAFVLDNGDSVPIARSRRGEVRDALARMMDEGTEPARDPEASQTALAKAPPPPNDRRA